MSFELTARAEKLLNQRHIRPQIILEIDGIPVKFGAIGIKKRAKFDDGLLFDTGLKFDTPVNDTDGRDWISLEKTTKNIDQQIIIEKGGAGSISSMKIEIINKRGELANLFKTGNYVTDILSTKAKVFLSFDGAEHHSDSIEVFNGIITEIEFPTGTCILNIQHPESKKRVDLFQEITTELTGNILSTDQTIPVLDTFAFLTPQDNFESYIVINDEIIQVTANRDDTNFYDCIRGRFGTIADDHSIEDDVKSFYRIVEDSPITLALKLYLSSNGNPYFKENTPAVRINQGTTDYIQNALFFTDYYDIQNQLGLIVGDEVVTTGSIVTANNTTRTITGFGTTFDGSYITLSGLELVTEIASTLVCKFKSKYNVYPDGVGLESSEVDIVGHENEDLLYGSSFAPIDIYIKETVEAKEFLEKNIFMPEALYSIPRKGKVGIKFTAPPIADAKITELSEDNIKNLSTLKVMRSLHENFYNVVGYEYEQDSLEDDFFVRDIIFSASSTARVNRTNVFKVEAAGFRKSTTTTNKIRLLSERIIDRYKFCAQYIEDVQIQYKTGFALEVGDVVLFGSDTMPLTDLNTGKRQFKQRLMEITNKKMNVVDGKISVNLLETGFSNNARYGLISVSSKLSSASSSTRLLLKTSFNDFDFLKERDKWTPFINEKVRIRSDDYDKDEIVTIKSFDVQNEFGVTIDPALTFPVLEDYIMEIPEYDESSADNERKYKILYTYMNPQLEVSVAIDNFSFETTSSSELFVGGFVQVHSDDYDRDSQDFEITDVTGDIITVADDMGFTAQVGDKIELVGYTDGGLPYKLV